MNLGLRDLSEFFERHRDAGRLVLATVTGIHGSSYRKPGAMMLVAPDLSYAGLISGGCLEGDLLEHARAVFGDGRPRALTYDLSSEDTGPLGLGLGCGGTIHLLLQCLDGATGFGVLPELLCGALDGQASVLALALEGHDERRAGDAALAREAAAPIGSASMKPWLAGMPGNWPAGPRYRYADGNRVLMLRVAPPPRLLVCGAGADAIPVAQIADSMGWQVTVIDHRPAYARAERFPPAVRVIRGLPGALAAQVDPGSLDAAIVMTHNLEHDAHYLSVLAVTPPAYLGLLGPRARRERLQQDLEIPDGVIRGPAGLDIGAELPAAIAVSIVAEIHAVLAGKADAAP